MVCTHPTSPLTLEESFHLQTVLVSLGTFQEAEASKIVSALREQVEIDSWASFLELQAGDLEDVPSLSAAREELLKLIEFMKGFHPKFFCFD
jgi:hypothetical protein